MANIFHDFLIAGPAARVFEAISTSAGLDVWWTKRSSGEPVEGADYELFFAAEHDWRAKVSRCVPHDEFELTLTSAQKDWQDSRVGFGLSEQGGVTQVRFHHLGWPEENEHYRISCFCWAMYLRLLKRFVEHGEVVPYERRLDV